MKSFIDHHNLLPRGVKLMAEDVWSRVRFVLSAACWTRSSRARPRTS
ncbi:DNA topoisomerase 4 subunit B [Chromobacterium violaceum]|uniref:DNA topoisomerase 4 subunit B n=1 Tax=Chromobacterium violaceum TaxID=536 RepID=A0A447T8F8_CHRVL|nr:DNA topoisomerase 4 subunit B [Chromobacterium violaceum]